MKTFEKVLAFALALCLCGGLAVSAAAVTFTDAHGNVIELDDALEAYAEVPLFGAGNAARKGETNLGDLWTLRVSSIPAFLLLYPQHLMDSLAHTSTQKYLCKDEEKRECLKVNFSCWKVLFIILGHTNCK